MKTRKLVRVEFTASIEVDGEDDLDQLIGDNLDMMESESTTRLGNISVKKVEKVKLLDQDTLGHDY